MIQLKVYSDVSKTEQFWIDLYETEPIKLNLSVEDITDAEARSVFSRTFRVPATPSNNEFFKNAFLIDGIDYDVTTKKPAEILVDGAEFRVGHIRLQKIYTNRDTDRIDYEIVFFGETRDFASSVGQASLADISTTSLAHTLDYSAVSTSWQAYPQGGATDGLLNGDVLYPLIDHGNIYVNAIPQQPRIAFGQSSQNQINGYNFNHSGNGIGPTRFKPMIRAKWIVDKIFEDAGFSYESNFFNSDTFRKLYVSAFGNEATIDVPNVSNQNIIDVRSSFTQQLTYSGGPLGMLTQSAVFTNEVQDPGNNWNSTEYTVSASGTHEFNVNVAGLHDVVGGITVGIAYQPPGGTWAYLPGTTQTFSFQEWYYAINSTTGSNSHVLAAGGKVQLIITANSSNVGAPSFNKLFAGNYFTIPTAPGSFTPGVMLDNEYKQIDFIKDLLTTFRLVMSPSKDNPKKFIIEPWNDYIMSGDLHDWSDKLVEEKDMVIEPVFFTQSDRIEFRHAEDADHLNHYNVQQFKETFGGLNFDAGNELLKGKRDIKVSYAPTPVTQILGYSQGAADNNMILPQLHTHEDEEDVQIHEPIRPKTRLLFYNGLVTMTGTPVSGQLQWYADDGGTPVQHLNYPRVSYWSDALPTNGTINLNWQVERGYTHDITGFDPEAGRGVFTEYWADYIESIYDKDARKVTAYFILNNVDLQTFSFDDVIFVNGTYYRPSKIIDAQIGERTAVKVELIKLLDYQPNFAIYGCTNPVATNYDPMANVDDGTCILPVYGCTDPSADNYDPNATVDNGSCNYPAPVVMGCTDPQASNYNPNATDEDGSCIYPVYGCTDPAANNYNPNATNDDGSCDYTPGPIEGCTNGDAVNYNPNATVDDGSCYFLPITLEEQPLWLVEPSCFGEQGTAQFPTFEGGDPPYTIDYYNNGQFVKTFNNINAGDIIIDFHRSGQMSFHITDSQTPVASQVSHAVDLTSSVTAIQPNITTTIDSITFNATGGVAPYTLTLFDGSTVSDPLPVTKTGLTAGTGYTYRIQDNSGCFIDGTATTLSKSCTQLRNETLVSDPGGSLIKLVWQGSDQAFRASQIVNFFNGNIGQTQGVQYSFDKAFMDINFLGGPTYTYSTASNQTIEWFYDGVETVVTIRNLATGVPGGSYPWDGNQFTYCKY